MRILIHYIYCTNGGVETAIKNRIKQVNAQEHTIELHFSYDYGGQAIFKNLPFKLIIESQPEKIKAMICSVKYDLIIIIDDPEFAMLLSDIHFEKPVFYEIHTTYQESLEKLQNLPLNSIISKVIVPSDYSRQLVKKYICKEIPISILPNCIDPDIFYPRHINRSVLPIVMWVGRLDGHKNWNYLTNIVKVVKERLVGKAEFWVVGGLYSSNEEMERFQDKRIGYDLTETIRWFPYVPYQCMPDFYSYVSTSGGCYISTSKNESFGMTVLESMACRCPVFCNKVGAVAELIQDRVNGRCITMDNSTLYSIVDALCEYLYNSDERTSYAEQSYKIAVEKYTDRVVSEQFIKLCRGEMHQISK